jgi:hypothetical protein
MTETARKQELLEAIERERAVWQRLVAEVRPERMELPGVAGDWTFKDVVAHLSGWRVLTVARLEAGRDGRAPVAPWPAHLTEENDLDAINDWFLTRGRERTLQQVLGEYADSFDRMRDAVVALPEQELFESGRYEWLDGFPLADVVPFSFEHLHDDHMPELRAWIDRRGRT